MDIKRILLVQTAFLGDTILVTPLIRAVHQLFPSAKIDMVVIPQTAGILQNNPHLHRIILFDKRKNKRSAFIQTLKQIRNQQYDLAITPHQSLTTGLLLYLSGIPRRIGFDRNPIRYFLTERIPFPASGHTIEKNLRLVRPFSNATFPMQTELFPSKKDKKRARQIVQRLDPRRPKIAIAPGSVWPTKRWPQSYYTELSRALNDAFSLIFIGSKDERALCASIIQESGAQGALNLAGELTLLESAALIALCDLMVCNDSGALHLANAVQTDVFAFFGPTVKDFGFYPFRANDVVFEIPDLDCRPCGKHGGKSCPMGHFRCMLDIKPKAVENKIRQKFA